MAPPAPPSAISPLSNPPAATNCHAKGATTLTTRWNFDALQPLFPAYRIEEQRTSAAIGWLANEGVTRFGLQKIFIEPHLKNALGITDSHIRFQGCRAARHDDHIHIQVE